MTSSWYILSRAGKEPFAEAPPKWQKIFLPSTLMLLLVGFLLLARRPETLWAVSLNGQVVGWVQDREALEDASGSCSRKRKPITVRSRTDRQSGICPGY